MANVFMLEKESPLLEIPDINSYNLYFGWYVGEMIQTDEFFDEYHSAYPDRCIGFFRIRGGRKSCISFFPA